MAKYLYFQDGHFQLKNSINRIGEYGQDWLKKFDELLSIAQEHKVDAIIDGGDLLHSPEPSYRVIDEIADRVEKAGITIYCLFGNHAQLYHSNEHSKYTGLAHLLKRCNYFKYLNHLTNKNGEYAIQGFEYNHNIEDQIKESGLFVAGIEETWKIAIVHAFVCPSPFPYASHVVCDDIKTNADLVLVAHYHKCWEKKVGDTQYLDIGCFGRNSVTEANIEPSCILLDTDKRSYEIIKLKSAKKPDECFNLDKIKEEKEFDGNIDQFVQSLESITFQGQGIENIIKNVAKEDNTKQEVVDLIVNKIGEVTDGL